MSQSPQSILKSVWGHDEFREPQKEIIETVLKGEDCLALLPTGGGKSICFQIPGLILDGLTLVISPLIALMRDQVENLNRKGIAATFINSSMSIREIDYKLQMVMEGKYKFLYCAPERLKTEMFRKRVQRLNVKLIAIDEAHCVSQWGYDFRPAYLEIHLIKELLPNIPMIALTATATPQVKEDIITQLKLEKPKIFVKSFRRDNLSYNVFDTENVMEEILRICKKSEGSGIIYTRTRKRAIRISEWLQASGVSAAAYHGGMKNSDRNEVQSGWIENKHKVIAATNAFGMGIDKPDVRFVIHYNLPSDLESYYQEAGRAGRDGKPCIAVAFKSERDISELRKWVMDKYPNWDLLEKHYNALCDFYRIPDRGPTNEVLPFQPLKISKSNGFSSMRLYNSIKILDKEGILSLDENPDEMAKVRVQVDHRVVLEYKDRYPDGADLLDFILRMLGGEVYSEYCRFNPRAWASQLKMKPAELEGQLMALHNRNIIAYVAPRSEPSIRFMMHKHKLSRNELNWHKYNFLRGLARERLDALMKFISAKSGCRSRVIQEYFGEKVETDCGVCDQCKQVHSQKVSPTDFDQIKSSIISKLEEGAQEYKNLLSDNAIGNKLQRENVLRFLVDKEIVKINESAIVSIKK